MVVHKLQPMFKVTTSYGGSNYVFENDQFLRGTIIRNENGFDNATLRCNDYQSRNWLNKMDAGESVKIELKDRSEASWTTVLDGVVRFINLPFSRSGEVLELRCDGKGYGFDETSCGEQYGVESDNPSLDTIKEVLTDASKGMVPKWVNKVLGTTTDSGYSYTTEVEDISGSLRYLYFPYKKCSKTLNDIMDIVQAIKGANAGPHWIVTTGGKLLVSTLGAHHAAAVSEGWTTYYGGSKEEATLEQGKDFLEFYYQKLLKEANYILYHGRLRKPPDGDRWTENNSGLWGTNYETVLSDDSENYKMGSYSLKAVGAENWDLSFYYPSSKDAALNIAAMGGKYNIPTISFYIMRDDKVGANDQDTQIRLYRQAGKPLIYYLRPKLTDPDAWYHFSLPIGPYYKFMQDLFDENFKWINETFYPSVWSELNYIQFEATPLTDEIATIWIDGLQFNGWILRGARPSAAYSATNPLKLKVITDDIAKDDSSVASDDSGVMARLAYAELLRGNTTPIVGMFSTPYLKDLLPGQLVHIHAKKKSDGSFNIDKDFRVTRLIHTFSTEGFTTQVQVTDDVTNSVCRASFTDINKILANARPEFQDRQATSIKTRDIDITQPILEKKY